ncbi:c-type cytochrome [Cyanobacterium aponinum UTEX 3222]|uniref:Photosystem II extrinsic protein V n=3 Tax=Cyanobacterium aponinum TaxID=379064 RepID=K9Z6S3_CYAAP|nr:c-type cytochrome [Cyanobacterium aponinum]WRL42140.1 c-type cytochrome [Cyanobacterium aponinum UTEX 3222]AFZ54098.1 Cytochrome c-550 [Cyanobacterium aponinum PCC 10605]MBD2394554.1 cytochrome c-550 [Cyanobacterium aponinum FACHB-4101]WPF89226.1 c-type cytochrome [Cyanobacterium aponinum AL20115]WRL38550.1 c-type cytochrome [Cyanobacterium aponinum UTEX 3221]
MKKFVLIFIVGVIFAWQSFVGSANALSLSEEIRTIPLNESGETITLSNQEALKGSRLFVSNCAQCHIQGKTKTNPNVSLSKEALANALPARDNLVGLMDYIEHPTSYDGEEDLTLLHVNTERPDLWPEIRNYSEDDIKAVAGHILIQAFSDPKWGNLSLIDN